MSVIPPEPGPPSVEIVTEYLGEDVDAEESAIASAYAAELSSQAARCRVPAVDVVWPQDLVEALCRRVAHNLALRNLPLGLQAAMIEGGVAQTRVGGLDAEVRRLEGPYRKLVIG